MPQAAIPYIATAIAAGSAYYSGAESQKNQLAADDRRKNAEIRQGELLQEDKLKKIKLEEQKAQSILTQNKRSLDNKSAFQPESILTSPLGVTAPYAGGAVKTAIGA